jgi:hypothetical protein
MAEGLEAETKEGETGELCPLKRRFAQSRNPGQPPGNREFLLGLCHGSVQ